MTMPTLDLERLPITFVLDVFVGDYPSTTRMKDACLFSAENETVARIRSHAKAERSGWRNYRALSSEIWDDTTQN